MPFSTPANPSAATPTIVNGRPLMNIVWPTIAGLRSKRRVQYAWLTTATGACWASSPAVNPRPSAIATPGPEKKLPLTMSACAVSGSAPWRTAMGPMLSGT